MAFGLISIIIGIIFFLLGFSLENVESAVQQTAQYLLFVCGSVFIAGSFICFTIYNTFHKKSNNEKEDGNQIKNSAKTVFTENNVDKGKILPKENNHTNEKPRICETKEINNKELNNINELKERIRKITDKDCNIFVAIDKNKFENLVTNCTDENIAVLFQGYYDLDDKYYYLNNCIDEDSLINLIHYLATNI